MKDDYLQMDIYLSFLLSSETNIWYLTFTLKERYTEILQGEVFRNEEIWCLV